MPTPRARCVGLDYHRKLQAFVSDLNRFYAENRALYEVDFHYSGFEWVDFRDVEHSVIAFLRKATDPNDFVLFCCNFTPVVRAGYEFGVPAAGVYDEVFNTDAECFGGSNVRNGVGIQSRAIERHGRECPSHALRSRARLGLTPCCRGERN